jgi:hypothetical protein
LIVLRLIGAKDVIKGMVFADDDNYMFDWRGRRGVRQENALRNIRVSCKRWGRLQNTCCEHHKHRENG